MIDIIEKLGKSIERASEVLNKDNAAWTRKFINDLPNAAFAVVEKGYKEGGNKSARHLPHHGKSVKKATENTSIDLPHYRNSLARVNQIKSVLGTESDSALRKKAARHLEVHRSVLKKTQDSFLGKDKDFWQECEELFELNVKSLLND